MFSTLPDEIVEIIYGHMYAMRIQAAVRRRMFVHTCCDVWKSVRKRVLEAVGCEGFAKLQENALVRREWREEISSWTDNTPLSIRTILFEATHLGLWK